MNQTMIVIEKPPFSHSDLDVEGDADSWAAFSKDRLYRYLLGRRWSKAANRSLLWILTNPSTAGAFIDDNTVAVCRQFSGRHGYGGMVFANLKAFIATDPTDVERAIASGVDVVGEHNRACIDWALLHTFADVAVAWGTNGTVLGRDVAMLKDFTARGIYPRCLGRTAKGFPRHPLRLSLTTSLVPFDDDTNLHSPPGCAE